MDTQECQRQAAQLETLLQEVAAFPDLQIRARVEELIQTLLEMYGEGLTRLLAITSQSDLSGEDLIELFAKDELISALLLLHGLHPLETESRIRQALESVRASTQLHGAKVELLDIKDGVVSLRLAGSCQSCSASSNSLRQHVEQVIYSVAPDLKEVRIVEDRPSQQAAVPVKFVPPRKRKESTLAGEQPETRSTRAGVSSTG